MNPRIDHKTLAGGILDHEAGMRDILQCHLTNSLRTPDQNDQRAKEPPSTPQHNDSDPDLPQSGRMSPNS